MSLFFMERIAMQYHQKLCWFWLLPTFSFWFLKLQSSLFELEGMHQQLYACIVCS